MKAAVIRGPKTIVIENRPIPEPLGTQVLIKIGAAGICGSDLRGFMEENSKARMPGLIIGHEAAGEVVELGPGATKFRPGDRVAIDPQVVCGGCYPCRNGWISVCDNKKVIGSSLRGFLDGAMAEYAVIHENQLYELPDSLSFIEGATIEPVSNALHAVKRSGIGLGETVVIIGAGTLGLCILQAAKAAGGVKVVVIGSTSRYRLDLAVKLGADLAIMASETDPILEIKRITAGRGADVVIDAAGYESTCRQGIEMTRKRGRLVLFGNAEEYIKINLFSSIYKELTLLGSSGANDECVLAMDFLASKRIRIGPIVTHQMRLEDVNEAFTLLLDPKHEAVKVVLLPQGEGKGAGNL
jgi:L-iditol 2-dehydrogenase